MNNKSQTHFAPLNVEIPDAAKIDAIDATVDGFVVARFGDQFSAVAQLWPKYLPSFGGNGWF